MFQFLSQCVVGASLEDAEEEEDDAGSVASGAVPPVKEGCYEVIGTLKDPASKVPDGVKEIIKVGHVCFISRYNWLLLLILTLNVFSLIQKKTCTSSLLKVTS